MKRIFSLLIMGVIAVCSCAALSSCSTPIFSQAISNDGVIITGLQNNIVGELTIPDSTLASVVGGKVVGIADGAFRDADTVTKVVIPEGVTYIGDYAFYGCNKLEEVVLPSTLVSIGTAAFDACPNLKFNYSGAQRAEAKVKYLGTPDNKFFAAVGFVSDSGKGVLKISADTVLISDGAFCLRDKQGNIQENTVITEINIPEGVSYIGESAFAKMTKITSVTIPESVVSVGFAAFDGCSSIIDLTIPFVGGSAEDNTFLGYIFGAKLYTQNKSNVPETITAVTVTTGNPVRTGAFTGCAKIQRVTLSADTEIVEKSAFEKCDSLAAMTLPLTVEIFGELFGADSYTDNARSVPQSLTTITINNFATVAENAFYGLQYLQSVYFSAGVASVGKNAFDMSSKVLSYYEGGYYIGSFDNRYAILVSVDKNAESFTVHDDTVLVADSAFENCKKLTTVSLNRNITYIGANAFRGCSSLSAVEDVDKKIIKFGNGNYDVKSMLGLE